MGNGQWGVNPHTGFTPKPTEIIEDEMIHRLEELGADMHPDNPLYHFVVHVARQLGEEWETLYENWKSGFWSLAQGDQKNLLAEFLLEKKRPATKAVGWVRLRGQPGASYNPGAITVAARNGMTFTNVNAVTINDAQKADALFRATQAGKQGNITAHSIVSVFGEGLDSADNPPISETEHLLDLGPFEDTSTIWRALPVNAPGQYYQIIKVEDIDAPGGIREISLYVKSLAASEEISARMRVDILSEDGQVVAGTEELAFTLAVDAPRRIWFAGSEPDLTSYQRIRVSPVLVEASGPVAIACISKNASGVYPNGVWHENGLPTDYVMLGSITSALDGEFWGGRDAEDDIDIDQRWEKVLATPGVGNPDSLEAWLQRLPGVLDAVVRFNPYLAPWEGMPAKTIHVIVDGGRSDLIAQTIWQRGFGARTYGSRYYPAFTPDREEYHMIAFDRATVRPLAVHVVVTPTVSFVPSVDVPAIKEAVVKFIGGPDRSRTLSQGRRIGEGVSLEKLSAAVFSIPNGDRKMTDIDVFIGDKGRTLAIADLMDVLPTERVRISLDDVEVTAE